MTLVERRIKEIAQDAEREAREQAWYMRCDRVRECQKQRNYDLIKTAVQKDVAKIKAKLSDRQTDFSENPAWFFEVRNPSPLGATVTVTMEHSGAELYIDVQRHSNLDIVSRSTVQIAVKGDQTYFQYDGSAITPMQASDLILAPLLEK